MVALVTAMGFDAVPYTGLDRAGVLEPGAAGFGTAHDAGRLAAEASSPVEDQRGPVDYKRHLADELTRRVLRTAVARAGALAAELRRRSGIGCRSGAWRGRAMPAVKPLAIVLSVAGAPSSATRPHSSAAR